MAAFAGNETYLEELRLCDWERSVANCKDPDFIKTTLIVCAILHLLVGAYGIWVLWYRNGGFKARIVTNLYFMQMNNIRPRPIDCIAFFTTVACFVKVLGILTIVLDVMPLWFRVILQQGYWWLALNITSATYMVGTLYALPVSERQGSFAVYRPQDIDPSNRKPPIYVLYPTPNQRDLFLLISMTIPIICIIVPGIISTALEAQGHLEASRTLVSVQYTVFGVQEWVWSVIVLYYGLKFTIVLRAHITATEARDRIPPKSFGYKDLRSGSPARYLLIMVRITVTARGSILVLSGSMAYIRSWEGGDFLRQDNEHWSHLMAVVWTCPMTIAYCAQLTLIAVHCSRSRFPSGHSPGKGVPPLHLVNGQSTLDMLTLHFDPHSVGSGSETWLDQALSQLAKAPQPGEQLREPSIYSHDTHSETDFDEEDLRKRVARSALISHSMVALAMDSPMPAAATARSSIRANEQATDMQEFRLLQMQHQSSQRRIRTLKSNRRQSVEDQIIRVLQRQLRDANQNLERLQAFYHQPHPLPGHQESEMSTNIDPAEIMRQLHLRNNMSVLQQQVKFTLRQLDHRIKACQSERVD